MAEEESTDESSSRSVGVEILAFILGAVVLAYIGGAFSAAFRTFPYPQLLEPPFKALKAQQEKASITEGSVLDTGLWHELRFEGVGLQHRQKASHDGYTVYTSGDKTGAFLLDPTGDVVHEWNLPFREAFEDPPHIKEPIPESHIYWRRVHLFPNGDIIASYSGEGDTPYGYGLVKVDKDSKLIWKYAGYVHHDFDVQPDGTIYALTHNFRRTDQRPVPGVPQLAKTILEDFVVKLSPEGKEVGRVSLIDSLIQSPFRQVLDRYPNFIDKGFEARWDPLHTNTVDVIGEDFAEHHAWAEPGQMLVSYRNPDTIGLLDFDKKRVVWANRGFWQQQHDPDPLPNGNILLFDNNGHGGFGGGSRILEFNPATQAIDWSYIGQKRIPFWSVGRGSQQRLPNGNVLISESAGGRILEVTPKGQLVWVYHNPALRKRGKQGYVAIVCSAKRYGLEELTFVGD